MKALKVMFALIFVLNIGVAFAEEVASDCSQIQDSTSRTGEDSVERPVAPTGTGATGA